MLNATSTLSNAYYSSRLSLVNLTPSPSQAWKPFYYHPHESLLPFLSDKYLALLAPIAVYWLVSLWFTFLDVARIPFFEQYRLHEPEEVSKRNKVSAKRVVALVLVQQVVQTVLGVFVLEDDETVRAQVFQDHGKNMEKLGRTVARVVCGTIGYQSGLALLERYGVEAVQWLYWWGLPIVQFWWAFFVMDAWQYALHRAFHESRFLYRHFHSHHHRLYVPYAFGALYNHPLEGLVLDSAGGAFSHFVSLMTVRQGVLLFTFSTIKTVCDHGGYAFPWWLDPLHLVFPNCAEYHDVHHQMQGLRFNYSQPFFVHFDVLFGTRISTEKFGKMREANKKRRERERADEQKPNGDLVSSRSEDEAAGSATSIAAVAAASGGTELRSRRANGHASAHDVDDVPADVVASREKDPLVTTTLESYRAKAGTVS